MGKFILGFILGQLLAGGCSAKAHGAEPLAWPTGSSPENIAYAHKRGLPDSIPVVVLCIRVDALGRELSRTNGLGHIALTDWLENHFATIDQDAARYEETGTVKLTVVYCGDVL